MDWDITLSEPDLGSAEISAITEVIHSKWLTMGSVTSEFESRFKQKIGSAFAFAVCNCTAALHLATVALGIGPGDEVICPALTFVATANAIRYTGAEVVFADVASINDLTIDPEDIRDKISSRTRAIMVMHYAGFACDMNAIIKIAQQHGLYIIEDAAHAPNARYRFPDGTIKALGNIGDIGCFSFFSNKNMTTGEGGMVVTANDKLADMIKLLRSHGMTKTTLDRHKGHADGYDVTVLGYNYRIDEIRSALGIVQLDKLEMFNAKRRILYQCYADHFESNPYISVPFRKHDINLATPHIMPVIVKSDYQNLKDKLQGMRIQTSKHYNLIPRFSLYGAYPFESKVVEIDQILTLPLYPGMSMDDVDRIATIIQSFYG